MKLIELITVCIIARLVLKRSNALKPADFCKLPNKRCIGFIDKYLKYSKSCELIKCQGIYSYPCTDHLCTLDRKYCDVFMNLRFLSLAYDRLKEKYYKLNTNFKQCSFAAYKFDSNDVCVSGKNCLIRDNRSGQYIKTFDCQCVSRLSYKCGSNYCSLHNHACHAFNSLNITSIQLKLCGNDEQIVQHRNFIYF